MATQYLEDPQTKEKIPFEWNKSTPPTSADIDALFNAVKQTKVSAQPEDRMPFNPLRAAGNLSQDIWDTEKSIGSAIAHPIETGKKVWSAAKQAGNIAIGGIEEGLRQTVMATDQTGKYSNPPRTPESKLFMEKVGTPVQQAISHPAETAFGIARGLEEHPLGIAALAMGGGEAKGLSTLAIDKKISSTIQHGFEKGIRPTVVGKRTFPQAKKYYTKAEDAVKSIVVNKPNLVLTNDVGEALVGKLPENLKQFSQAIDQTKRDIFHKYNEMAKAAGEREATIDLTPISKELDTITESKPINDLAKDTVKYINERSASFLESGSYTSTEAQEAIKILNNSLEAFYKNPTYDTASKAYIDSLIANRMRSQLDAVIEQTVGEGYSDLKKQYGSLKTIEKEVNHRATVDARKNNKGLIDFTDVFSGYHVIQGLLSVHSATVGAGLASKALATLYRISNDPNHIIKKMFSKTNQMMEDKWKVKGGRP